MLRCLQLYYCCYYSYCARICASTKIVDTSFWLGSFAKNKPYGMALYQISVSLPVCANVCCVSSSLLLLSIPANRIPSSRIPLQLWTVCVLACAHTHTQKSKNRDRDCVENHVNLFKLHRQTKPTLFATKPFQTQTIRSKYAHTLTPTDGKVFFALAKFICTAHGAQIGWIQAFILYYVEKWSASHNSHIEIRNERVSKQKKHAN